MRNRLLLKVLLPANQATYDFRVSCDVTVSQGAQLMSHILGTRERARYSTSSKCELMLMEGPSSGCLLDPNITFAQLLADECLVSGSLVALL
ncbi:MAG: hypothetical protein IKG21_03425 [Atopobiaceae bacterium]|nr:hypothetical protein [Atopobiaceae bacterium]